MPADDLTDPSPATTFLHLDSTVVLSRDIASLGIYPAVDPLDSTSRQLDPAGGWRRALQHPLAAFSRPFSVTRNCATSSRFLGMDELAPEDKLLVSRARKIQRFLSQPVLRGRSVYRFSRQVRPPEGNDQGLQDDSQRVKWITCPSRPSTWLARSKKSSKKRRPSDQCDHRPAAL